MKKTTRWLAMLFASLMLLGALASCGKKKPTPGADSGMNQPSDEPQTTAVTPPDDGKQPESTTGSEESTTPGEDPKTPDGDDEVIMETVHATFMSFNIRVETSEDVEQNKWINRRQAVFDFLLEKAVGVIGFQEVKESQYIDLKNALSDRYEVIWYASYPGNNAQGNALAYDKTVWNLAGKPHHFWLSDTPDVMSNGWGTSHYRSCIEAPLVHLETGARIMVYVTHLDHKSQTAQENGMKLILERMKSCEYPAYLCGDFNVTQTSAAYKLAAAVLQDAQVTAHESDTGTSFHGWDSTYTDADNYVIDFMFFKKENVEVLTFEICKDKYEVDGTEYFLSDHNAVTCEVKLSYVPLQLPDIGGVRGFEDFDGYTENN